MGNFINLMKLTPKQQAAWDKFEKAYKECQKSGIGFGNNYGELFAFDKKKVNHYGDSTMQKCGHLIEVENNNIELNSIRIVEEWSDDQHALDVTDQGFKIFNGED